MQCPTYSSVGHVYNIPTMQFPTGISKDFQSKPYYAIADRMCLGIRQ